MWVLLHFLNHSIPLPLILGVGYHVKDGLPSGHRREVELMWPWRGHYPSGCALRKAWCLMISFFPNPASLCKKDPEEKGKKFPHLTVQIRWASTFSLFINAFLFLVHRNICFSFPEMSVTYSRPSFSINEGACRWVPLSFTFCNSKFISWSLKLQLCLIKQMRWIFKWNHIIAVLKNLSLKVRQDQRWSDWCQWHGHLLFKVFRSRNMIGNHGNLCHHA